MINSIKHRGLRRLYEENDRSGVRADHAQKIKQILSILEAAETLPEINIPALHLHALTGDRRGSYSVTVRANWRITFTFRNGYAYDVNLEDYH